jgi:hypothetical protein
MLSFFIIFLDKQIKDLIIRDWKDMKKENYKYYLLNSNYINFVKLFIIIKNYFYFLIFNKKNIEPINTLIP